MPETIWCNGTLIPADELRVSPHDRGLTVGLGLFETLRAVEGRPRFLDRHLARHSSACRRFGWSEPDAVAVGQGIRDLLVANRLTSGNARVRLFQTGGRGALDSPTLGSGALTILTATPLPALPESLSLTLSPWVRNERSPLSGLKCASYAENLLALQGARASGFDEPLFLNTTGQVCEAATANLFLVREGRLLTPGLDSGCLPGILRALVLELAVSHGIPAEEATIDPSSLASADELFLTSSLRGIVPVTRLDGQDFAPGPLTSRLRGLLA